MNELEEYEKLVELAKTQRDTKSRLKGSLDVIIKNLKDIGYNNLAEAKKDLAKKEALLKVKSSERSLKTNKFKVRYGKYL